MGFEQFSAYLNGHTDGVVKNADWASEITGIGEETIMDLAEKIKKSKLKLSSIYTYLFLTFFAKKR